MKRTLAMIKHEAAPTGAVIVYFKDTNDTLRYNAGGANEGWWWQGRKINEDEAAGVLSRLKVRAVIKP